MIKPLDSEGFLKAGFFGLLSDVPACQNVPVKYSFRYRKWYFNDLDVAQEAQSSFFLETVLWKRGLG